ncbi:MAG: tetratricopeptide repeat protein [Clostridia bacterium]|nr:tetratricopeptide repeat protein [Clostridia bacterium]
MAKRMEIDLSDGRLMGIATDLIENHQYIEGLKMLNKTCDLWGNDEDSYILYAEIYDDMGLYDKSVNSWFRFIDCAGETPSAELTECYEGLAVCFMNLGDERFSAYYYNKMLSGMPDGEFIPQFEREDILNDFMSLHEENPLKFVYPPRLADCTDILKAGFTHMKSGEYEAAEQEFEKVAEGNPKYLSSRNYIAMCKLITDRTEDAAKECESILEKQPDNVQALTTLAAVMTEEGRHGEAKDFAKRLLSLNVSEPEDIYKIATVCCENKMHAEAYDTFCKLPEDFDYDLNVLYFKGISAFNCGRDNDSVSAFDKLLTVHPEAVTARYYSSYVREMISSGERVELSYFYRLPTEVRESSLKVLAAYAHLPDASAKKLAKSVDLTMCVRWCFDEIEAQGGELQALACRVAVKAGMDELVREYLLNAFLSDKLKLAILHDLAERNANDVFGVVICNVYKRVVTQPLQTGSFKRKLFIRAYAKLFSSFAILDADFPVRFAEAAEELYVKLETQNRLGEVKSADVLSAAVYVASGVQAAEIEEKDMFDYFNVKKAQVYKLLNGE